jgi:hypothetical protein
VNVTVSVAVLDCPPVPLLATDSENDTESVTARARAVVRASDSANVTASVTRRVRPR